MGVLDKVQELDRRYIYLLAWIFVLFPLIYPLGLPIPINKEAKGWFEYMEKIPSGSTVIFSPMYGTSGMPELFPMTLGVVHQLLQKNVKIVVVSFWSEGPLVFDILLRQIDPAKYGKTYGVDWINLGYIPGAETAMGSFAKDIWTAVPKDYLQSKPMSEFPMMKDIRTAKDIDLIISIETGTPGLTEWLRQWNTPFGVPIITGCIGVSAPGMAPYLASGQLSALLPGLTSSAEYEILIRRPGLAVAGVDAVSMSHLLVVLLVIICNVAFFVTKFGKGS